MFGNVSFIYVVLYIKYHVFKIFLDRHKDGHQVALVLRAGGTMPLSETTVGGKR